jgi:hypothetical protein
MEWLRILKIFPKCIKMLSSAQLAYASVIIFACFLQYIKISIISKALKPLE